MNAIHLPHDTCARPIAATQRAAEPGAPLASGAQSLGTKAYIVCHKFFEPSGNRIAIGGVETYVATLVSLFNQHNVSVTILQHSETSFRRCFNEKTDVITWGSRAELQKTLANLTDREAGLVVYSDYWCVPNELVHPCVVLQHGVGWDYWGGRRFPVGLDAVNLVRKRWRRRLLFRKLERIVRDADAVLCVDTNFPNWVRTEFPTYGGQSSNRLVYIPNFASLPPDEALRSKWSGERARVRCIYPRRFAAIRGSGLFASVVQRLSAELPDVEFVFLGEGEEQPLIQGLVGNLPNVQIYSRPHEQMAAEYLAADVAVIPTLAAEGTSLSCIEAMAAGCAVVATTVGGLGNLILPDYNGILCEPSEASITGHLRRLLIDRCEIRRLGENARRACVDAFSQNVWEKRVTALLADVIEGAQR